MSDRAAKSMDAKGCCINHRCVQARVSTVTRHNRISNFIELELKLGPEMVGQRPERVRNARVLSAHWDLDTLAPKISSIGQGVASFGRLRLLHLLLELPFGRPLRLAVTSSAC